MKGHEVRKLTELEDRHWWYRERRHLLARELRTLRPGLAMDLGAAGGGNTRVLRRSGWRSLAVEYGEEGAEVARDRGLDVVRADATDLPLRSKSLDLVVAFDVLEHIPSDVDAAAELNRVLKPGGTLLVAVPADMRLWSAHDEAVGHVRRYDRESLRQLLEKSNFHIETLWSWNVVMRPIAAWRRRKSTGSDLDEPGALINSALTAIIRVERYLPVHSLPGVSLMLRAHRLT